MAVKHMSGTPWHVETLGTGEGKQRHRSHCRHFDYVGKQCNYGSRCFGSAHCQLYEVMSPNEERKKRAEAKKIAKSNEYKSVATQQPNKQANSNQFNYAKTVKNSEGKEKCPVPVGAIAKSKVYKEGKVIDVQGNVLTIIFDEGVKKFSYPQCLESMTFIIKEKL